MKVADVPINELRVDGNVELDETLMTSIGEHGVLRPITVRSNGTILDGRQRWRAAKAAGLTTIPCYIVEVSDAQLAETNVMESAYRIPTKPVEYARQLKRLIDQNPDLTSAHLAEKIGKSAGWISCQLSLLDLCPEIADRVDDGTISVTRAYGISKLTHQQQRRLL